MNQANPELRNCNSQAMSELMKTSIAASETPIGIPPAVTRAGQRDADFPFNALADVGDATRLSSFHAARLQNQLCLKLMQT